jgi:hypothetical protein
MYSALLRVIGTRSSARTKEKAISAMDNTTNGFINEAVLIPEVLMVIISLFLTIKIRKIKIEIRKDKGKIRFR